MKLFAIRDETDKSARNAAYLIYYEGVKKYYIELPEDADAWNTPLLLASRLEKKEHSINSYWSELWVRQRIVPTDRQNLAQILKDNGLKEYDEFKLLSLSRGRCAQDDYYIVPMTEDDLPEGIKKRFARKVDEAVPLKDYHLLVFFRDKTVRYCNLFFYMRDHSEFSVLLDHPELFDNVQVLAGGFGVGWDERLIIPDQTLKTLGTDIHVSSDDFRTLFSACIISAQEAAELLNCSRQYISELVIKDKLHPVRATEKNTLFLRSEVLKQLW